MNNLWKEIHELTEKKVRYENYLSNSEADSKTEWFNKVKIQDVNCEIRIKINELLLLVNKR